MQSGFKNIELDLHFIIEVMCHKPLHSASCYTYQQRTFNTLLLKTEVEKVVNWHN